jgi:uncharacterized membrane protein
MWFLSFVFIIFDFVLTLSQPGMVKCFLSSRSFHRVDFKQPSHKVDKGCIRAVIHALLKSSFLSHEDVDLKVLIALFGLLWAITLALGIVIFLAIFSFLVDKAFSSEEVGNKASFFHHVLWDRTDDAHHTR